MHDSFYLQQDSFIQQRIESFGQAEFHDMMAIKKVKVIKIQNTENISICYHHEVYCKIGLF
jgi:hypothetical protein